LRAVRRRWKVIVITVLVAGVAAYITTETVAPVDPTPDTSFQASVTLLPNTSSSARTDTGGSIILNPVVLAELVKITDVAAKVADEIGFDGDPRALTRQISASADQETGILKITATAPKAKDAEVLANTFAEQLLVYVDEKNDAATDVEIANTRAELEVEQKNAENSDSGNSTSETPSQGTGHGTTDTVGGTTTTSSAVDALKAKLANLKSLKDDPVAVEILEKAQAQPIVESGIAPPNTRAGRIGLGMLLGLFIGVGLALVVERFDSRVRTKDNAEQQFGAPVLAEIPKMPRGDRGRIVSATRPASPPAEAFRLLGAGITRLIHRSENGGSENGAADRKPIVILVTSAGPSEGKSTVVANLAAVYGEVGRKVLVLSCDLRRPSVHLLFDMEDGPGLTEALASRNGQVLNGCVERTGVENVSIVTSGKAEGKASLLGSDRMRRVLAESRQLADVVIMDTAPILVSSEVAPMIPEVDAVLIVAEAGKTSANLAEHTSQLLKRLGASSVGVALNQAAEISVPKGYHKYYVSSRPAFKNGDEPDDEDVEPTLKATAASQVASTPRPASDAAGAGDDRTD
ncbi:MAG TPA: polysaccharide biosynthesis tyrosine autokinase, partial [Actinomycetota bacterium]|nr:polysaccharide biosynthesis tyrosine autokinase [Actinomycetota bacterium]